MIEKYGVCSRCKGSGYIRTGNIDGSTDISICPQCKGKTVTEIKFAEDEEKKKERE